MGNIAILMSTYKASGFLDAQIESLANQTVATNITLYIRNDGDDDEYVLKIINKWRKKLNIEYYKGRNLGPALSFWNLLMNPKIQADYYLFCDQDDIWDHDKVEKSIEKLTGKYWLSFSNCRIVDSNGKLLKVENRNPDYSLKNIMASGSTQGCSMCFNNKFRKYIMKLNITCIPMHDYIVMLYAVLSGKVYFISEPLFSYRVHGNNVVAKNKNIINRIKNTVRNWNNARQHSIVLVSDEIMTNISDLSKENKNYLEIVKNYKTKLSAKIKLLNFKFPQKNLSYIIRVLLNLI